MMRHEFIALLGAGARGRCDRIAERTEPRGET